MTSVDLPIPSRGGKRLAGHVQILTILVVFASVLVFLLLSLTHSVIYNDFFGFIPRAEHIFSEWQSLVHPYYPLGYPVLLHLMKAVFRDYVLAGKVISALSAGVCLMSAYLISSLLFDNKGAAIVSIILCATHPLFLYWSLSVGVDLPFSALLLVSCFFFLQAYVRTEDGANSISPSLAVSGGVLGAAYLLKYTALTILPVYCISTAALYYSRTRSIGRTLRAFLVFLGVFFVVASLQLIPSVVLEGNPFFNRQVENVWRGIYSSREWITEALPPAELSLAGLIIEEPWRFLAHWRTNLLDTLRSLQWELGSPLMWFLHASIVVSILRYPNYVKQLSIATFASILSYIAALSMAFVVNRFMIWVYVTLVSAKL